MTRAEPPFPAVGATPRWGLGDVALAWLMAQAVSVAVILATLGLRGADGRGLAAALAGAVDGETYSRFDAAGLLAMLAQQIPLWSTMAAAFVWVVWVRGADPGTELGVSARAGDLGLGFASGIGAQLAVGVLYALLGLVVDLNVDEPARRLAAKGTGLGVVVLFVAFAFVAPVLEELFYRSLLLSALARRLPSSGALVVSALVFAAVHFQAVQFPGLLLAGLVFGWLFQRRGLGAAIAAHVGFNAASLLFVVASR